jgi:hypothetical protein
MTVSVAYGFAATYIMAPAFSLIQVTTFLVSGAALFRVGTFIHEIVHMSGRTMVGFRVAWNIVCGVPLLMHSLLYSNHLDHHNPRKHGTPADGEYLPLASAPTREIVSYFAQVHSASTGNRAFPRRGTTVLSPSPPQAMAARAGVFLCDQPILPPRHPADGTSASLDCTGRSLLPVVGHDSDFGSKGITYLDDGRTFLLLVDLFACAELGSEPGSAPVREHGRRNDFCRAS